MTVSIDRDHDIAVVTIDNPPVNALGQALRQGLWDAVATLDADPSVRAVVLICAGRTFIAGADVTEFGKPPVPPHLPDLVTRIENAAKPWTAAIHGSALGGGFEVAMGCRFRVALDTASVGLPEVTLGIVPGASGTVRTPRLGGIEAAVDLVTTGRPVKAPKARAMGLIDATVTGDLRTEAIAFTRRALTAPLPAPVSARPVTSPDAAWWDARRNAIALRAKGEAAPLRALDCLRFAAEKPFAEAMAHERATFLDLRGSEQAAALRYVFFAERAAPRPAHLDKASPRPIRSATVIGNNTTAADIATALTATGIPVSRAEDPAALTDTDLVIEALPEGSSDKSATLARLARSCRPDAILATTGSTVAPHTVAQGLPNPARIIGLSFPAPLPAAKLLELLPFPDTTPDTIATGFALARVLNLIPVQSGNGKGSIANRILSRYRAEVEALSRDGIPAATIDTAMRAHGVTTGPFLSQDAPEPQASGTTPQHASQIAARLTAAMAAEGRVLLAEATALKPSDIDLVAVHGLGYPRWRGGPMFEAGQTSS